MDTTATETMTDDVDSRALQRQVRGTLATHRVIDLLEARPELRGIHAPADFLDAAVRWCA